MTMAVAEAKAKVSQLESAIQRLDSVRKHLNTNAADIKSEIHTNVTRNVESLQSREATLHEEVAKVLKMKEETLQRQQVRLNQALTVLRTGLALVLHDAASEKQLQDTLERLKQIEMSPEETPYISFRADHIQLRDNILHYGRVDGNGLPLMTAFDDPGNPSASLPRQVEEYEDAEHHVFYKTLQEVKKTTVAAPSINVSIPKLSNRVEDWLQKKLPSSLPATPVQTPSPSLSRRPAHRPSKLGTGFVEGPMSTNSTPGSSCSLNNWLSIIKQHADLEEEHDFEIFDNSTTVESSSEQSSSKSDKLEIKDFFHHIQKDLKMWLQPASVGATGETNANFFSHISSDTKLWLRQAYQQLTSLEELKQRDFFGHISKDLNTWLRTRAHAKLQQAPSETDQPGQVADPFSHISTSVDVWLMKQKSPPLSRSLSPLRTIADQEKWLLKSSVPAKLDEMCFAGEPKLSKCISQPNCASLCGSSATSVFKPLQLSQSEWLLKSNQHLFEAQMPSLSASTRSDQQEQPQLAQSEWLLKSGPVVSEKKIESDLLSHISSPSDPCWLITREDQALPMTKSREETNIWLQKSTSSLSEDTISQCSLPLQFSISDWLMVGAEVKKSGLELELAEKEDSDGWSVCTSVHSVNGDQHTKDVATAAEYYNKWLI